MRRRLLPLLAAMAFIAGCGGTPPPAIHVSTPAHVVTYVPPESSITPEGAMPLATGIRTLTPPSATQSLVTPAVLLLLEQEEGSSRCAYWDSFGGVETVGFGQTHINGHSVPPHFCFSSLTAEVDNLKYAIEHEGYLSAVVAVVGSHASPGIYTGEISFVYNLGAGIYTGQLRLDLERHAYFAACQIQERYDHAGGVVLADLARRRVRECDAILATPPKPKQTPKARLFADYRARRSLDAVLAGHHCLNGYTGFSHQHRHECTAWRARHGVISRDILRLHRLGIY